MKADQQSGSLKRSVRSEVERVAQLNWNQIPISHKLLNWNWIPLGHKLNGMYIKQLQGIVVEVASQGQY